MSLYRTRNWNKKCFVYCGPERCNCAASATQMERIRHADSQHDLWMMNWRMAYLLPMAQENQS